MEEYLYEISEFLPIDDFEISEYFNRLSNTINNNYKNNEYQFSYIGVHMLLMTYLYFLVWQISKMNVEKYELTILFARPYKNMEMKFENIKSIFDFRFLPEKDVVNYLYLIGFDKSYLKILRDQIEVRNDMAHASGSYLILDKEIFDSEIDNILSIIRKCNDNLCKFLLQKEYITILFTTFIDDPRITNDKINNFIDEKLITELSLSQKEIRSIASIGKNKVCSFFDNLEVDKCIKLKLLHSLVQKMCKLRFFA